MKTILKFSIVLLLFVVSAGAYAQSAVHISDLNPGTDIDSAESSAHKVRMTVNFKVDNVAQADSVFFKFGTTPGAANIITVPGEFKLTSGNYFVKVQGPSYQVVNTEASCKVKINQSEFSSSTYLSLVVKDKSGQLTNVLHLRIN